VISHPGYVSFVAREGEQPETTAKEHIDDIEIREKTYNIESSAVGFRIMHQLSHEYHMIADGRFYFSDLFTKHEY